MQAILILWSATLFGVHGQAQGCPIERNTSELNNASISNNVLQQCYLPCDSTAEYTLSCRTAEIDLSNNALIFVSTEMFAGLAELTSLDITSNRVSIIVPGSFRDLSILYSLYLGQNRLSSVQASMLTGLFALSQLDVSGNEITDVDSDTFQQCTTLSILDMSFNNLTDIDVDTFASLIELTELHLQNNMLRDIQPLVFVDLTRLRQLHLGFNNLSRIPVGLFDNLADLEELYLSSNFFTQIAASDFAASLINVTVLDVHDNFIRNLPDGVFAQLPSLVTLDLGGNLITTVSEATFQGLTVLEDLYLLSNIISEVPENTFANLRSLRTLVLESNSIHSIPNGLFAGLTFLVNLDLSANGISFLPNTIFAGLSSLETLSLAVNQISGLPILNNLASLGILDLYSNNVTFIPSGALVGFRNLSSLDLGGNKLHSIDRAALSSLATLTELGLGNNMISAIPSNTFANLTNLKRLYLYSNNISSFEPGTFAELASLDTLMLYSNIFTAIPSSNFQHLTALKHLDFGLNLIQSVPIGALTQLPELVQIDLSSNAITHLADCAFCGLSNLKVVTLSRNNITFLVTEMFSGAGAIEVLDLSSNCIVICPVLSDFPSLITLDLSANAVTSLQDNVFAKLPALQNLYLADNGLASLPSGFLAGLTELRLLVLTDNSIVSYPQEVLNLMRSVPQLYISPNVINCTRESVGQEVACTSCLLGFQFDPATISCNRPQFGISAAVRWNTTTSNVLGRPGKPSTLYIGRSYILSAPALEPKDSAFEGYTGRFEDIIYRAEFPTEVNLTCKSEHALVAGDTAGGPIAHMYPNPVYTADCTPAVCGDAEFLYDSPQAKYTFDVAVGGGNFTFDTCLSEFTTSILILKHNDTNATMAPWQVWPTTDRNITVPVYLGNTMDDDTARTATIVDFFPWVGGCGPLSLNARTPSIHLSTPGKYSVVIQAGPIWDVRSPAFRGRRTGRYVLRMFCGSINQTNVPQSEQLRLQVDPTTGAVAVTPMTNGSYEFNLTAVDGGSGATTVVSQWAFNVVSPPVLRLRPNASFTYTPSLQSTSRLVLNWTYTFHPPPQTIGGWSYFNTTGNVTYRFTQLSGPTLENSLLTSEQTGLCTVRPVVPGSYSVAVQATDGLTTLGLVNPQDSRASWTFEVLPFGSWNDVNGPNRMGCGSGIPIPSSANNGSFVCDCSGTEREGRNCNKPQRQLTGSTNKGVIIGVSILTVCCIVLLVCFGVQRWKNNRKPFDFNQYCAKMLKDFGTGTEYILQTNDFGFRLTIELNPGVDLKNKRDLLEDYVKNALNTMSKKVTQKDIWTGAELTNWICNSDTITVDIITQRPTSWSNGETFANKMLAQVTGELDKTGFCGLGGERGTQAYLVRATILMRERVPREIKRKHVHLLRTIGRGNFGKATLATLKETHQVTVVCKQLIDEDVRNMILVKEANILALINMQEECDPHIVGLVGVVTVPRNQPRLLVLEYCDNGSLDQFLPKLQILDDTEDICLKLRLSFCADIASGLGFLAAHRVIHCDVAAKNIFVDAAFVCKVGDFGLATIGSSDQQDVEDLGVQDEPILKPCWPRAAPELFEQARFSTESDIWAFGVTALEIISYCANPPYRLQHECPDHDKENEEKWQEIVRTTFSQPNTCPDNVYTKLLDPCWARDPRKRPKLYSLKSIALKLCEPLCSGEDDERSILVNKQLERRARLEQLAPDPFRAATHNRRRSTGL